MLKYLPALKIRKQTLWLTPWKPQFHSSALLTARPLHRVAHSLCLYFLRQLCSVHSFLIFSLTTALTALAKGPGDILVPNQNLSSQPSFYSPSLSWNTSFPWFPGHHPSSSPLLPHRGFLDSFAGFSLSVQSGVPRAWLLDVHPTPLSSAPMPKEVPLLLVAHDPWVCTSSPGLFQPWQIHSQLPTRHLPPDQLLSQTYYIQIKLWNKYAVFPF